MGYKKRKHPVVILRDWYLKNIKWRRYSFGKSFHAGRNVQLWAKKTISIGDYCYIGAGSKIFCDVNAGKNLLIANNVAFVGKMDHFFNEIGKPIMWSKSITNSDYPWIKENNLITIEDDVWIGFGAIILSGVSIGRGSIIAAGSIVTKNVAPFSIYAGVPAKKIADRFNSEEELNLHIKLFEELMARV